MTREMLSSDAGDPRVAEVIQELRRGAQAVAAAPSGPKVYEAVLQAAQAVSGADRVSLGVMARHSDSALSVGAAAAADQALRLVAGVGIPAEAPLDTPLSTQDHLCSWVWAQQQPVVIQGATHRNREVQARLLGLPDRSSASLPLVFRGQALGVLNVSIDLSSGDTRGPLDTGDLALLQIISAQAS